MKEVTTIPREMENLGFKLVPYKGTNILLVPSLECPYYTADLGEETAAGYFTEISFFPHRKIVSLRTSDGERGRFKIDVENGSISLENVLKGEKETSTGTYEPDEQVKNCIGQYEERDNSAAMHYVIKQMFLL
jgi:hypothetical protein